MVSSMPRATSRWVLMGLSMSVTMRAGRSTHSARSTTRLTALVSGSPRSRVSVPAPLGVFNGPNGVAVSPDGSTAYVADTFNQRIQEFDGPSSTPGTQGTPVQQWGSRLPNLDGAFSMDYPRGVAVDPADGSVWAADTRSGDIKQYTTTNRPPSAPTVPFEQDFGGEGLSPGQFFYSDGITAAPGAPGSIGNVFNPTTLYIPDSGIGYFQVMQDFRYLGHQGHRQRPAQPPARDRDRRTRQHLRGRLRQRPHRRLQSARSLVRKGWTSAKRQPAAGDAHSGYSPAVDATTAGGNHGDILIPSLS